MRRRGFLVLPGIGLAALAAPARAEPRRAGYLWQGAAGTDGLTTAGLRQGLAELGYVEGRDIAIDYRYADGVEDRLSELATALVSASDVIICPGAIVTRAVQRATRTVPVVSATADPVGLGFAASLARPGGNITGVTTSIGPMLAAKWVELLHEAAPAATRLAMLHNTSNPASVAYLAEMRRVAGLMGLAVLPHTVRSSSEFGAAFAAILADRADAMIVDQDPLVLSGQRGVVAFAAEHRLPALYGLGDYVTSGGLMSYSTSIFEVWRRAATHVDRILRGASPGELPIEQPTRFELRVNIRAARSIGLAVPASLLARADEVIE